MKKYFLGFIVGVAVTITGSVYADEGLQKVEAYLRPSLPVTLDGAPVTLESSPVMYDGSTYLKLRDIAKLTGLNVNWNESTQTVELGNATVTQSSMKGASSVTDVTYSQTSVPQKTAQEQIADIDAKIADEKHSIETYKGYIEGNKKIIERPDAPKESVQRSIDKMTKMIADSEARIAELEKQKAALQH